MNINRVNSGIPLPRTEPANRSFDLTVSDRGVTETSVRRPGPEVARTPESPVASNPALQEVLSAEETELLRDRFFAAADAARPGSASAERSSGVYNLRGIGATVAKGGALGEMVDLTG